MTRRSWGWVLGAYAAATVLVTSTAVGATDVDFPELGSLEASVAEQLEELQQYLLDRIGDPTSTQQEQEEAYGELARHYQAYGLTRPAEECYLKALDLAPDRFEWNYYLGRLLKDAGSLDQAELYLRLALSLFPRNLPTLLNLSDLYLQENRLTEAELVIRTALEVEPSAPSVQTAAGEFALAQQDYTAAIEAFEEVLVMIPEANRLHYLLGMAYRGLGNLESARQHLAHSGPIGVKIDDPLMDSLEALKLGETVFLLRGRSAYRVGRYQDSVEAFRQAVEAAPESVRARVNLGSALAATGDRQPAIDQFEAALELDAENATAWFNLGSLHASEGELEEARRALGKAIAVIPDDGIAQVELGNVLLGLNKPDESLEHFQQAVVLDPEDERALLGVAEALVRSGRYVEARSSLERAHDRLPTSGLIARALARLLTECPDDEIRDGRLALPLALSVWESQPTAWSARTVALSFAELGNCAEAHAWQERAIGAAEASGNRELSQLLLDLLEPYPWETGCSSSQKK